MKAPFPGIVRDPEHCWGQYRITGTRLVVRFIVGLYRAGETVEYLAEGYQIPDSWIVASLAWHRKRYPRAWQDLTTPEPTER